MKKNQGIAICLLVLIAFYVYLESVNRDFEEAHLGVSLGFAGIGSASYTATAGTASLPTINPFILGTSTLGSNARLG